MNPAFGGLSFGITAGESIAGHQNTAAQAQSKAVNLGVIGVTLAGEGCEGDAPTLAEKDQPQPVIVSSDEAGAAEGKSGDEGRRHQDVLPRHQGPLRGVDHHGRTGG